MTTGYCHFLVLCGDGLLGQTRLLIDDMIHDKVGPRHFHKYRIFWGNIENHQTALQICIEVVTAVARS